MKSAPRNRPPVVRGFGVGSCPRTRTNSGAMRLKSSGATYLFIGKNDPAAPTQTVVPAELVFAREEASTFQPVFENPAAAVFKIVWKQ